MYLDIIVSRFICGLGDRWTAGQLTLIALKHCHLVLYLKLLIASHQIIGQWKVLKKFISSYFFLETIFKNKKYQFNNIKLIN